MKKDTNPKTSISVNKVPLHLVPPTVSAHLAVAYLNGAHKYGRMNWRETGASASVYVSAALRHINAFMEGENIDDEGVHHLAAAMAGLGIILDALAAGVLNDDRNQHNGGYSAVLDATTAQVETINDRYDPPVPVAEVNNDSGYTVGDVHPAQDTEDTPAIGAGQTWMTRGGAVVDIIEAHYCAAYPLLGVERESRTMLSWKTSGAYLEENAPHRLDLVELIP